MPSLHQSDRRKADVIGQDRLFAYAPLSVSLPSPSHAKISHQRFAPGTFVKGIAHREDLQTSHWTRPASMPLIALQPKSGGHLLYDVTKGRKIYLRLPFPRWAGIMCRLFAGMGCARVIGG